MSVGDPLLDVRDLRVTFHADTGSVRAVDGVSFALGADEVAATKKVLGFDPDQTS